MMTANQITIAFPTYMRRDAMLARLEKLLPDPLGRELHVLVIDDASNDGTYEAVQERFGSYMPRLTLRRNERNLGMSGNFCEVVRACATEYFVIMSDEDDFLTSGLSALIELLGRTRALFVAPQAFIDGNLYRGENTSMEIDRRAFFMASFYISGLVYETAAARDSIKWIERSQRTNILCYVYPTVIFALELMLLGPAQWLDCPLSEKSSRLSTYVRDLAGGSYGNVASRWQQHMDFIHYLQKRKTETPSLVGQQHLDAMLEWVENSLYDRLLGAIRHEHPASAPAFRRMALERELPDSVQVADLKAKLENFRGMIARRDQKIARLTERLEKR